MYTHTCVYAHISAWVCTHVHVIAHACRWTRHSPDPIKMWIDSLLLPVFIHILFIIYSLNIYFIYILNQLRWITVKMADKIVAMTIKILSLNKNSMKNILLIMSPRGERTRGWLCWDTTCMCQNIHTHTPKHRPKCTYMEIPVYIFFRHPTV